MNTMLHVILNFPSVAYIENNRLVPWMETVYLARRRNLLGEPKANPMNSVAEPDKLSPSKALTCYSIYPVISLNNILF